MSSPEAAIIEAWRYLETQQLELADRGRMEIAPSVRTMPRVLSALLYKEGVLNEAQHDLVERLRDLRNEVAHNLTQAWIPNVL